MGIPTFQGLTGLRLLDPPPAGAAEVATIEPNGWTRRAAVVNAKLVRSDVPLKACESRRANSERFAGTSPGGSRDEGVIWS